MLATYPGQQGKSAFDECQQNVCNCQLGGRGTLGLPAWGTCVRPHPPSPVSE